MRSSVPRSVPRSVPSSTGPGASPAFTVATPADHWAPAPALTGPAQAGEQPETPDTTGEPSQWPRRSPERGWSPAPVLPQEGAPEPVPGPQPGLWVTPAVTRGVTPPITPPGNLSFPAPRDSGETVFETSAPTHGVQSQDVDSRGWIQRHVSTRVEPWIRRWADTPENLPGWPVAEANPSITPLAPIAGATKSYPSDVAAGGVSSGGPAASEWSAPGVSSSYQEPSANQPTSPEQASYQADPGEEWL